MAYDKVVDSAVLDAGLKQVADAIREKGGTSDNLAFPTGMAAAVSAIQTGGGGGGGASEVVLASDCSNAAGVYNLFRPMCDDEAECNVFAYKGDASTLGIDNKLVYLFLNKHSPTTGTPGTSYGAYVRYRNSAYNNEGNMSSAYTLIVSAGDTYIHWALKP